MDVILQLRTEIYDSFILFFINSTKNKLIIKFSALRWLILR